MCYWPCGPDCFLKFSLLCFCRTVQNLCFSNSLDTHICTCNLVFTCNLAFTCNLVKVSLFYLLNLTDERPDNLPSPLGNETDPEIKVETLTGNDTHSNTRTGLLRNPSRLKPDQTFSWNGHWYNVNIVTL